MQVPLPDPPLRGEQVLLRPWTAADAPGVHQAFGDPVTLRFSWGSPEPYGEQDARAFLVEQEQSRRDGTGLQLALVRPGDDALLGGISLYDLDRERASGAVGYWLAPAARGRGIATAAVLLLVRWGFESLGLARIELTCAPDNLASQRVAERAGFLREGLLRSHLPFQGGRRDSVLHSLLPADLPV